MTARQITVYFQDMVPDKEYDFSYPRKAEFPVKAKSPATETHEYHIPNRRGASQSTDLEVTER